MILSILCTAIIGWLIGGGLGAAIGTVVGLLLCFATAWVSSGKRRYWYP
jgi:tetrahydromethanopterin S-methyltransferase subunit G